MTIDEAVKQLCEAPSCLSKSKAREILKEYGREVIDKCIEALPPLSTDHEWNWSEGYNQYYLEAHKKLNNLK